MKYIYTKWSEYHRNELIIKAPIWNDMELFLNESFSADNFVADNNSY